MSTYKYKIVYIGAGSFRFTIPCALNILDFAKDFNPIELWLVDIDVDSLKFMGRAVRQMIYMQNKDIELHLTTDRRKALSNADYVLISISVGIQEADWYDIYIPLKFGIPQNTGDTVGPGGIFRAVRTIPIITNIIRDIYELAPNATVLNYTNPQGTLMLSAIQAEPELQSIGLCHEFFYVGSKKFARLLEHTGVDTSTNENFDILYGGVNHFAWITDIKYGGEDIYPQIRDAALYGYESEDFGRPFNYYLLNKYGYLNYVEDRHVAEFMPRYYNFFNYKDAPFGMTKLRHVQHLHWYRQLVYDLIRWGAKNNNRWFVKLFLRPMEGGEKALLMAKDKERNLPKHHVCNVLNNGAISSLPDNCVVEIPCYFQDHKIHREDIGALPSEINELVKIHATNQQLVVEAALSGDPDDLLKALLADPMCQFIENEEKIEQMMKNLLYYERKWLPQFSESIPTYEEIKNLKYYVEKKELRSIDEAQKEKYKLDLELKQKAWPQVD
ncbi:MAG: hypothetical protein ACOC35_02655 [Promethearchaeia archaeon]